MARSVPMVSTQRENLYLALPKDAQWTPVSSVEIYPLVTPWKQLVYNPGTTHGTAIYAYIH